MVVSDCLEAQEGEAIVEALLEFDRESDREILMMINCRGGTVDQNIGITNVMRATRSDVRTVVYGVAMSAGASIAMAGTKGKRHALPNALFMIHEPRGEQAYSSLGDMRLGLGAMEMENEILSESMALDTGKDVEEIAEACRHDFHMTADQALSFGIIDSIVTSIPEEDQES